MGEHAGELDARAIARELASDEPFDTARLGDWSAVDGFMSELHRTATAPAALAGFSCGRQVLFFIAQVLKPKMA
jgi:surfactin synthase thioesterase subunit